MASAPHQISPELLRVWEEAKQRVVVDTSPLLAPEVEPLKPIGEWTISLAEKIARSMEMREARRQELRASHPDVACLECLDTGYVTLMDKRQPCYSTACKEGQKIARRIELRAQGEWLASIDRSIAIPTDFHGWRWDQCDPRVSQVVEAVRRVPGTASLYLVGPFGRGKSVIGALLARGRVREHGRMDGYRFSPRHYGQFITVAGLLQSLRPDPDDQYAPGKRLARYQTLPVLVLDDIGAERLTEWGADQLFEILNERAAEHRPTIVTSNYPLDELAAHLERGRDLRDTLMGQRIVERLKCCEVIEIPRSVPNWRDR